MIAITLVAGVAIAGYAFNLFGQLGNSANVSVGGSVTCKITANTCTLSVSNSGTADGTITSCHIGTDAGTVSSASVPAGSTISEICTFTALPTGATAGAALSGTITVNGNLVSWAGLYN